MSRLQTAEEEQRFLAFIKDIYSTDKRYLLLDMNSEKGSLRVRNRVLREFPLLLDGCRKPQVVPAENADAYVLPKGRVPLIAIPLFETEVKGVKMLNRLMDHLFVQ